MEQVTRRGTTTNRQLQGFDLMQQLSGGGGALQDKLEPGAYSISNVG
jgi:hypothetical protein